MLKNFLSFTRSEQYGILALMILIIISILIRVIVPYFIEEPDISELIQDVTKIGIIEQDSLGVEEELFLKKFNPNEVTKEELISFGFPNKVSENWIKYREKGGRFYKKEDVQKIYGVTDELYNKMSSYLIIEPNITKKETSFNQNITKLEFIDLNRVEENYLLQIFSDNSIIEQLIDIRSKYWFSKKVEVQELTQWNIDTLEKMKLILKPKFENKKKSLVAIDINLADTTEWMQFQGIGPVLSLRIVNYRKKLGGFIYKEQLLEVYGVSIDLFEKMKDNLLIEAEIERKININKASVYQLRQHPYINFYIAKAIVDKRLEVGEFSNIEEVNLVDIFEEEQWTSISPYFSVE